MSSPKVTVFMAVFNASNFIADSISSILNQTFANFELLIIDDGSTDETVSIIKEFDDERIRLFQNHENKGLPFTRNRLLELAEGQYIAVLDSDDIAFPDRLESQINFLSSNPDVALCGGHAEIIDKNGNIQDKKLIVPTDEDINMHLLFLNPFINSSTMFKMSVFRELEGYRNFALSEDYDLFLRISEKHKVANIDKFLVKYRIHGNNITLKRSEEQLDSEQKILGNFQAAFGIPFSAQLIKLHVELFSDNLQADHYHQYKKLFAAMKAANYKSERFNIARFNHYLFEKWLNIIKKDKANKNALNWYLDKDLFAWKFFSFKQFRKVFKISFRGRVH